MFGVRLKQSLKKFIAYHAPEAFDPSLVKEVDDIWNQHDAELNEFWRQTNSQARENLVAAFLKELEQEWPSESSELSSEVVKALLENLKAGLKYAYGAGYMRGRGWILAEQETDYGLCLGDMLARDVKAHLKGAKSRGLAFASAFTAVAVQGHLVASGQ